MTRITKVFYWLVWGILLTPLVYSRAFEYPFVTPKAMFLQTLVEMALPFYLYLIITHKHYRPNLKNPLTISILAFWFINLVSGLLGVNVSQSFWGNAARMNGIFNLLHLVLVYFYILLLSHLREDFMDKLVRTLVWVAAIAATYGIWAAAGLPKLFAESFPWRFSSFFGNPIFFASFLTLPFFLTILYAWNEGYTGKRVLYIIFALIDLAGIYVSKTRGAYLGLIIGVLAGVIIYLIYTENKKLKIYGLGAVLVVLLFGGFVGFKKVHFDDNDSKARLIQWKMALKGYKEAPILGTGPGNYYVVANKYYDPKIYNYDASYWDQPHNNLISNLVTTGILGLAAYLAINISAAYILYKAYRKQMLSQAELSIFFSGLVTYQVQNFFVFDTAAANLAFFFFLSLVVYCLPQEETSHKSSHESRPGWLYPAVSLASFGVIVLIYYANLLPARAFNKVGKAIAVGEQHPEQGLPYLIQANNIANNTPQRADIGYMAEQYASDAIHKKTADNQTLQENVDQAIAIWEPIVAKVKNEPTYWLKLANLYYAKAYLADDKAEPEKKSEEALNKIMQLAPKRVEAPLLMAKLRIAENQIPEAEKILDQVLSIVPQDPNSNWHYKQKQEAISDLALLIRYYAAKQDYGKIVELYLKEVKLDPRNADIWSSLAAAYAKYGNKAEAIKAAEKVLELKPEAKADVEAFIQSLK